MTNIKNKTLWVLGGIVALLVLGSVVILGTARADGGTCVIKIGEFCLKDVINELKEIAPEPEPSLGAVSGPDTYFPYTGENDVRRYASRMTFRQGTTTVCSFRSPAATSSLEYVTANINTSTSSITTVNVAKALNDNNSTSTLLFAGSLPANVYGGFFFASSTATNDSGQILADHITIFAPSTNLNVSLGGHVTGDSGFNFSGNCNAVFYEI